MKIKIFHSDGTSSLHEVDSYNLADRCIQLYKIVPPVSGDIVRLEEKKRVAAFWGIQGFMVLDGET